MKLTYEEIVSVTRGTVEIEARDEAIHFFRFTKEQMEFYRGKGADWYQKAHATAGVILEFDTNSENLSLVVKLSPGSSRKYFVHSVFVNEERIGELAGEFQDGETEKICRGHFLLRKGFKRVRIVFPWSAASQLYELTLDDGASILPVRKAKKILLYGDSITQGYDAAFPENSYASQLVKMLDADGINKAIGGEVFSPALAGLKDDFTPDLITVAYGTNDWSRKSRAQFEQDSRSFFLQLRNHYPDTPILTLAPVWRSSIHEVKPFGSFHYIAEYFTRLQSEIENMAVIDCIDFIPHTPACYKDHVHPNDQGFAFYFKNLCAVLTKMLLKAT